MTARRVLILGGTFEAAGLAQILADRGDVEVTSALAGLTRRPRLPAGRVRIGGFGGVAGLAHYLRERQLDLLIDATHPFAARISANAARAAASTGTPRLVLARPHHPANGSTVEVADVDAALAAVADDAQRVLVTFRLDREVAPRPGLELIVRAVEPPARPPPERTRWLLARGPFRLEDERHLLERLDVDALIAKASGGAVAESKVQAAQALGLRVIVVARPPSPPGGDIVASIAEAVAWLDAQLRGRSTW